MKELFIVCLALAYWLNLYGQPYPHLPSFDDGTVSVLNPPGDAEAAAVPVEENARIPGPFAQPPAWKGEQQHEAALPQTPQMDLLLTLTVGKHNGAWPETTRQVRLEFAHNWNAGTKTLNKVVALLAADRPLRFDLRQHYAIIHHTGPVPSDWVTDTRDPRFQCLGYPAVITPNGDGLNEEFLINCLELYGQHRLDIYSRWGQLVYETTAYGNDWRGTTNDGQDLPDGPYYFVLEYLDFDGVTQELKGAVTLSR